MSGGAGWRTDVGGFAGRERELGALHAAWDAALAGAPRVVGVEGDPGIGKTTLVRRFLERAAPHAVLWADADEDEVRLPWSLLTQITQSLGPPASHRRSPLDEHRDPRVPEPADADPWLVARSLALELRARGPLVLVVDDAHWGDQQSMTALRLAARRLADAMVLLVLVHQTPGELSRALTRGPSRDIGDGWRRLLDTGRGTRLRLDGLDAADLVRLAAACGHPRLSPAGAARLHDHTGGNPLHVRHLLDEVPMRSIVFGHGPLPAPRGVAAAVRARLAACGPATRELVAAGAVLGRRFGLARVREMTGHGDLTAAAVEAIGAGLLVEVPGSAGHELAFTGTLVRGLAYHDLDMAVRRGLHRRAVPLVGGPAAIWHRIAAADGTDPGLAADVEHEAHVQRARGRPALAAVHLRQALDLTPAGPERVPRLLTTVEALLVAGDAATAREYQAEVSALGPGAWPDYVSGYQHLLNGRMADARRLLKRSLAAVRDGGPADLEDGGPAEQGRITDLEDGGPAERERPPDLEARVATQLAIMAVLAAVPSEMIEYGAVAVAAAREPWVAAFGWFAECVGLALSGQAPRALAALTRADAPGAPSGLEGLVARGVIRLWSDDLPGARDDLGAAVERAARGEPLRVGQALGFLAETEYRMGALGDSVLHAEPAVGDAEEYDRVWDYAMVHALAAYPLAAQASWERAEAHAAQSARWARHVGTAAGLTYAAAAEAALAQARDDATRLLAAAEDLPPEYPSPEPGTHLLGPLRADALSLLGRPTEACEALEEFLRRPMPPGRLSVQVCVARVRAQIAAASGDLAEAVRHCHRAVPLARAAGLRLEEARLDLLMGGYLDASGRRAAAERALRAAYHRFTAMGAAAYAARTRQAAERAGLSLDGPPAALGTLTPAERAVVALVCEGLSNREIAERMVLSRKTIEFHLTNVFRRLDVPTRADLRRVVADGT
ncbi:AAA family ATPase [Sphaerisporangium rubeum]|uniref:DNA-binding CsgD family transcriptional regulator n=1 Tax=Sphaerisporangium rubeum TaxID=321317 RepID=A0A7X0IJY6_9ACTN|nr:DNA-binding CsgD family transcriptional regulator [Sphaerisporangium rubeum]